MSTLVGSKPGSIRISATKLPMKSAYEQHHGERLRPGVYPAPAGRALEDGFELLRRCLPA